MRILGRLPPFPVSTESRRENSALPDAQALGVKHSVVVATLAHSRLNPAGCQIARVLHEVIAEWSRILVGGAMLSLHCQRPSPLPRNIFGRGSFNRESGRPSMLRLSPDSGSLRIYGTVRG